MKIKTLKIIGIVFSVILGLLPVLYICSWTLYLLGFDGYPLQINEHIYQADQSDPVDVADAFIFSLADNRIEDLKGFVVEERWDFLEKWPNRNFSSIGDCQFYADPDYGGISVSGDDSGEKTSVGVTHWIDCPDGGKSLSVFVNLIKIDNKWFVADWTNLEIE